jgi:hypothetical protein
MKKLIIFLESDSMNLSALQVNVAVKALWKKLARMDSSIEIRSIRVSKSAGEIVQHLPLLQRAHKLIFPSLEPVMADVFGLLRRELELRVPAIFHLLGHASSGPGYFLAIDPYLLQHDEFLICDAAEKKVLSLSFERPRTIRVPYLVRLPRRFARKGRKRFIYVGRISEQKNLHSLLRAFALLEKRNPGGDYELRIYGSEDRIGSPDFGISALPYLRSLKALARRLGVRSVRWMGFVDQERLDREVLSQPHVFVSPSLHIGENFGMAAFRSLELGNPAVLSAWGGHRELKRFFGRAVYSVPVWGARAGPFLVPGELCFAMERAWREKIRGTEPNVSNVFLELERKALKELRKSLRRTRREIRLRPTRYYEVLRKKLLKNSGKKGIFNGYADPAARKLLRAMGMRPLKRT